MLAAVEQLEVIFVDAQPLPEERAIVSHWKDRFQLVEGNSS